VKLRLIRICFRSPTLKDTFAKDFQLCLKNVSVLIWRWAVSIQHLKNFKTSNNFVHVTYSIFCTSPLATTISSKGNPSSIIYVIVNRYEKCVTETQPPRNNTVFFLFSSSKYPEKSDNLSIKSDSPITHMFALPPHRLQN